MPDYLRIVRRCLLLLVLTACAGPEVVSSLAPSPVTTVTEASTTSSTAATTSTTAATLAVEVDLETLLVSLETIHPEPFHGIDREAFVEKLEGIATALEARTPEETMVAMMKLWASLSREGRDGHQIALPMEGAEGPMLPLRVFEFSDGVFVTDAIDPSLVGVEIVAMEGRPIEEILATLEPLVPRDSPATVSLFRPLYLLRADVLQGLGLIESDEQVSISVSRPGSGDADSEVVLETVPFESYQAFSGNLGIIQLPTRAGFRFLEPAESELSSQLLDPGTLYAQLDEVQLPSSASLDELVESLANPDVSRVIFDLRHNPGGNNFTYPSLLEILQGVEQAFFVMIDRGTFSAASNLATEIEQTTEAVFAGEAMGGGLNFWDDVTFVPLRNLPIPLRVGVSTVYHEKSFADDPRLTIEPDLIVPYVSDDFFSGNDRALELVLNQ